MKSPPTTPSPEELRTLLASDPLVALAFDGVLVRSARDPRRVRVHPATRELVNRLARSRPVAVLSERPADDVRRRLETDAPLRIESTPAPGARQGRGGRGAVVGRLLRETGRSAALVIEPLRRAHGAAHDGFRVVLVRGGASVRGRAVLTAPRQRDIDEFLRLACETPVRGRQTPDGQLPLEFLRLLWAVDHGMRSVSKAMEVRLGISGPQRVVLRTVQESPGMSPGEVARALRRDASTLTPVLAQLQVRELLRREPDPRDARRARLVLTPAGERACGTETGTVEGALRQVIGSMSPEDLSAARLFLAAVATALQLAEV